MEADYEEVIIDTAKFDEWIEIPGTGIEVMIRGTDLAGVLHLRKKQGVVADVVKFVDEGGQPWTPGQ